MNGTDPLTLAYFAGVMDGEGCIAIRRTRPRAQGSSTRYSVSVTVGNTSRELIARLISAFDVGSVVYRYATRQKKACYLWSISSGGARIVLEALLPYLVVKRPQAEVVLEYIHRFDSFKGGRSGAKGAPRVSDAELARRAALYVRSRELNRVGNASQTEFSPNGKLSVAVTARFRLLARVPLVNSDGLDAVADLDGLQDIKT